MSGAVEEEIKRSNDPRQFYATFTVASDTTCADYVPEVGSFDDTKACNSSGAITAGTPQAFIQASTDILTWTSSQITGPVVNAPRQACEVSFTLVGASPGGAYSLRSNGDGVVQIALLIQQSLRYRLSITGTTYSYAAVPAQGDVIKITDDGTTAVNAIKVYINGTLRLAGNKSNTSSGTLHGIGSAGGTAGAIDNWEIT